jgi:beta-glucanase (GH16 family)
MKPKTFNQKLLMLFVLMIMFISCAQENESLEQILSPDQNQNSSAQGRVTTRIAPAICDFELNETTLTNAGWTKIFEDNFTTDLSKWNIWTGGAFNNELQHYQASNLQIVDGKLVITAKKEIVTGATTPYDQTPKTFNYTSGRIECKSIVSANPATPKVRMIARIKLASGYGMWPAFWTYGDPWPTQGEIDMIESRGQEPTKYQTNYFYGTTAGTNLVRNATGYLTADQDLTACYHVYEMIWEQNTLTSYLDGNVVEIKTTGNYIPSLFGKQEHIVLNLAVGGAFFSRFDATKIQTGALYVDWVKVFTSN